MSWYSFRPYVPAVERHRHAEAASKTLAKKSGRSHATIRLSFCPDWADLCKHVAAVLYGVGARLDGKPELFFTSRGVEMEELLTAVSTAATEPVAGVLSNATPADSDLAEFFGVEVESSPPVATVKAKHSRARARKRKAKKKPGADTLAREFLRSISI